MTCGLVRLGLTCDRPTGHTPVPGDITTWHGYGPVTWWLDDTDPKEEPTGA